MQIEIKTKRDGNVWFASATIQTSTGPVTVVSSANEATIRRALLGIGTSAAGWIRDVLANGGSAIVREGAKTVATAHAARLAAVKAHPLARLAVRATPGARQRLSLIASNAARANLGGSFLSAREAPPRGPMRVDGARIAAAAASLVARANQGDPLASQSIETIQRAAGQGDTRAAAALDTIDVASQLPPNAADHFPAFLLALGAMLADEEEISERAAHSDMSEYWESEAEAPDFRTLDNPGTLAAWLADCGATGADCSRAAVGPVLTGFAMLRTPRVIVGAASSDPAVRADSLKKAVRTTNELTAKAKGLSVDLAIRGPRGAISVDATSSRKTPRIALAPMRRFAM